jgi:hypothetical protein
MKRLVPWIIVSFLLMTRAATGGTGNSPDYFWPFQASQCEMYQAGAKSKSADAQCYYSLCLCYVGCNRPDSEPDQTCINGCAAQFDYCKELKRSGF